MEKQTVFIKRYPSKGELPNANRHNYRVYVLSNQGFVHYDYFDGWEFNIEYWLEEISLPDADEIKKCNHPDAYLNSFHQGANFILNKLKGDSK